jgi:hypothetical protein
MTQNATLDRRLKACDPASTLATPEIDAALDEIGAAIVGRPRGAAGPYTRRWLTRPRRGILIAAALVSLAGGVTAAKTLFTKTYTGTYAPKWAIPGAGPGEILNTRGTDFRRIALGLSADIPYPTDYISWRNGVLSMEIQTQTGGRVPSGQLRGEYAMAAICTWVLDWRSAMLSHDRTRAAHDAAVLSGALHWRAVTAWDPHPSISVRGDDGTTHPSTFGWAIPYIAAVRAGDLAKLDRLLTNELYEGNFLVYDPVLNAWQRRTRGPLPASYLAWLTRGRRG